MSTATSSASSSSTPALYFDGRSARPRPVRLDAVDGVLRAWSQSEGSEVEVGRWPLRQVQWPERTRHGQRVILLAHPEESGNDLPLAFRFSNSNRATGF